MGAVPLARTAALATLLLAGPALGETLKIATLAPEGSSWMRLSHAWQKAVETRTEGRVRIKFYSGGVLGDERDCLRKIRLGQISGASLTGIGLATIVPEVRTLDLARTYLELDGLRAALDATLRKKFEERGFVLLGWGDVGPVHLFSNRPVRSMADLQQLKIWQWTDDPVSSRLFRATGLRGVPMGVPDVLPGLSTGQVDSFPASPLAALALQWSTKVRYVTSMVLAQASGATLIAKPAFDRISPEDRRVLLEEAAKLEGAVLKQIRADNADALAAMKKSGLQLVETPPAFERELRAKGEAVAEAEAKSLPSEFQAQVRKIVDEYRAHHPLK
jgi:TRAP-type C4-dicarboxylate transport system substrate-binding protein